MRELGVRKIDPLAIISARGAAPLVIIAFALLLIASEILNGAPGRGGAVAGAGGARAQGNQLYALDVPGATLVP